MAEAKADIQVFNQSGNSLPFSADEARRLATAIARNENCLFRFVEVVYVTEKDIVRINKEHLGRDYVTDIITFRYDEPSDESGIEGTLFCCAPRIKEQAKEFKEPEEREFRRIFIHGLLHLAGYDDQSKEAKRKMTERENFYLEIIA